MANCANCGAPLKEGAMFCENCGAAVTQQAQPEPAATPGDNYQQNYQPAPQPQPAYQQSYQQPVYSQPAQQTYAPIHTGEQPVGIGDWFLTQLLLFIPIVNIVMLCVWAFGNETPESKSNWAKAQLIWMAIGIGLSILFAVLGVTMIAALAEAFS